MTFSPLKFQHVFAVCHPLVNGQIHLTDLFSTMNESGTHIWKKMKLYPFVKNSGHLFCFISPVELDDIAGTEMLSYLIPGAVQKWKKLPHQVVNSLSLGVLSRFV